ncbi:MAG TPA: DUF5675 family protein [Bacteroidota bacterium]|nr:DUF5675 family protein [Bacteroidota bacterium]
MRIVLKRNTFNPEDTEGIFVVDDTLNFFSLEPTDRHLTSDMTLEQITAVKVQDKTAIPYGQYQVIITDSPHFGRPMPLLVNVPGFEGVRIHWGNTDHDTDGCILLGESIVREDFLASSRIVFDLFFPKLQAAIDSGEGCLITIIS